MTVMGNVHKHYLRSLLTTHVRSIIHDGVHQKIESPYARANYTVMQCGGVDSDNWPVIVLSFADAKV